MDATELLRAAGWAPQRTVDITADIALLRSEGFEVSAAAETFLREFSHLTLHAPGRGHPIIIDGVVAARHAFAGWAEAYSAAIGQPVTPVGEYSNLTFWVDETGDFWATFDDAFGHAGQSLVEVVQGLFFDDPGWQLDRTVE